MTRRFAFTSRIGSRGAAVRYVLFSLVVPVALLVTNAEPSAQSTPLLAPTAGSYADLAPYQQRLFDQVLQRYNAIARTRYAPAAAYDAMPPSRRTTFEAVTNALSTTALTDETGASLGSGIDIVEAVDEIAGETRGARGDRQFRLYVVLEPDAVERLTRSREFRRGADNTIYHPGYPMSFRLTGGTPSIQVSISRDGRRGDVDVDYRSSTFPIALFNGHLTSANSDVRAGGNYDRHQQRWTGLGNWWQRFLGLFSAAEPLAADALAPGVIPVQPRLPSDTPIEAVVEDFLQAWLVEQRPELSAAYFSPLSFACFRDTKPAAPGLERHLLVQRMKAANDAIGKVETLPQVSVSVNPWDRRLRVRPHRLGAAFLLAQVPSDLASAYDCTNRAGAEPSLADGEYFASAFRLRVPGGPAPVLVLLWTREPGGLRVVAMDVEEAAEPSVPIGAPARPVSAAAPRARRVAGPAPLVDAATAFHRAWLLERNADRALSYFDEASYGCLPAVSDGALGADRESMRKMLAAVSQQVAPTSALDAAIRSVEPAQRGVDVVAHPEQRAFAIVPVGDAFADRAACGSELPPPAQAPARGETESRGRAFVSYFQLNVPGDPAFLLMLWTRRGSEWRIPYWTVVEP